MHLSHQFPQSVLKREPECLKIRGKQITVWHRLIDWGNMRGCARFFGGGVFVFVLNVFCAETRKCEIILVITGKKKQQRLSFTSTPQCLVMATACRKQHDLGVWTQMQQSRKGLTTTSVLSTGKQGWICRGSWNQKVRTFSVFCFLTSGTCQHLPLPHRSVMLRKYFNAPCNALKKKSPHSIAVKPRDCLVLISLAIKVLNFWCFRLCDLSQDSLACFPRRDELHTGSLPAINTCCTAEGAQAPWALHWTTSPWRYHV